MFDIKLFDDERERETVRELDAVQTVVLTAVLMRLKARFVVTRYDLCIPNFHKRITSRDVYDPKYYMDKEV